MLVLQVVENLRSKIGVVGFVRSEGFSTAIVLNEACKTVGWEGPLHNWGHGQREV